MSERETKMLSENLRGEYERQLTNIRNLKALYEERQRADRREKDALKSRLEESQKEVEDEQKKNE